MQNKIKAILQLFFSFNPSHRPTAGSFHPKLAASDSARGKPTFRSPFDLYSRSIVATERQFLLSPCSGSRAGWSLVRDKEPLMLSETRRRNVMGTRAGGWERKAEKERICPTIECQKVDKSVELSRVARRNSRYSRKRVLPRAYLRLLRIRRWKIMENGVSFRQSLNLDAGRVLRCSTWRGRRVLTTPIDLANEA